MIVRPLLFASLLCNGVNAFAPPSQAHVVRQQVHRLQSSPLDDLNTLTSTLLPIDSLGSPQAFITEIARQGGPPVMALAVAISDSVPLVPTQPISLVAGALFGIQMGLPAVILGQLVATTFAMLFGRYVLANSEWNVFEQSDQDKGKLSKVLDELTAGLNSDDFKSVFLTIFLARQSPVLPFSLGNYFVGAATKAPLVPAVLATVCGCLPLNLLWVGAGAGGMAALDMVRQNSALSEGLEVAGALATLAIVGSVAKAVAKVWNEDEEGEVQV